MKSMSVVLRPWIWTFLFGLCLSAGQLSGQSAPEDPFGSPDNGPPPPLVVVATFLQLSDTQIERLIQLREEAEPKFREIHFEVQMREEHLHQEVESEEPDTSLIGELILEIGSLREEGSQHQRDFVESFAEALDDEQQRRLHLVLEAVHLQHVLPAFHLVGLVP